MKHGKNSATRTETAPRNASVPRKAVRTETSTRTEAAHTPAAAIRKQRIRVADRQAVFSLLCKVLILAACIYVLFGVLFGLTPMKGGDMQPKFAAGDLLLYYRMEDSYARNDVVVMNRDGSQYVGRIIGMPGDTIEITPNHVVRVNGNNIVETEIFFETEAFQEAVQYPLELGGTEYFLLGDNREVARDSRYFGAVDQSELRGRVITAVRRTDL